MFTSSRQRIRLALPLLVAGCSALGACGGSPDGGDGYATASDAISAGYVYVAGVGAVHPSCVHIVEDGTVLDPTSNSITHPDGRQEAMPPHCEYAAVTSSGASHAAGDLANGWMEAGIWEANRSVGALAADYGVPDNPHTIDNHTFIAEFPSLEHTWPNPEYIIQPVLQWNQAGFSREWSIVAEAGGAAFGGHYYQPNPQRTWTNHIIRGELAGSECSGNHCAKWTIVATDLDTGRKSSLVIVKNTWSLAAVAGGVLEAYGIKRCSDLPGSWTKFYNVDVRDQSGGLLSPPWEKWINISACGDHLATSTHEVDVHP